MNDARKLEAIADEIEQYPERWCQGIFARDADGKDCEPDDFVDRPKYRHDFSQWCGAGLAMRDGFTDTEAQSMYLKAKPKGAPTYFSVWNDAPERTPADIVALFRKAAALARTEPGR